MPETGGTASRRDTSQTKRVPTVTRLWWGRYAGESRNFVKRIGPFTPQRPSPLPPRASVTQLSHPPHETGKARPSQDASLWGDEPRSVDFPDAKPTTSIRLPMAPDHRILSEDDHSAPPPPLSRDEHSGLPFTHIILIAAAVFAGVLLFFTYYAVLRRRRRPLGAATAGGAPEDDDATSLDEGEPFHHVWYIRTVGLDESIIGSIAVAEYKAGDGLFDGASDCSVCLGEFRDGELVRLLPKCGHAFHISCIDTWLRDHVNCPLCRSHIVDPDAEPATPSAAAALPTTAAGESVDLDSGSFAPVETSQMENQALEEEDDGGGPGNIIEIGIPVNSLEVFDSWSEGSVSRVQSDLVECGLQPVGRSVSMDTPSMNAVIFRVRPEEGPIDEEGGDLNYEKDSMPNNRGKQGNSSNGVEDQKDHPGIGRSLSSSGRGFFFSRHGRVNKIHSMPM
ncbi:hypothetical protein B296_00014203 [Ensete ventricosum]|uniref:RING-type E3 ubiquitin transferase n=1 Tax=Ensete ventricosum TaxID=4639 RepID=A0A426ZP64_ENSVE|nr:hypothetical protein B296_00014203 [Ensete ventricosum]